MASITKWLTIRRFAYLLFVFIFMLLLAVGTINFYAVHELLLRFEGALPSVVALSVSLIIFPFITVPAVESVVERAEKLGIKVNQKLLKDYVDGSYTVFLLAVAEMVLIIVVQLVEEALLLTLAALTLLSTLIIVLFIVVYSLWEVTRILQDLAAKG